VWYDDTAQRVPTDLGLKFHCFGSGLACENMTHVSVASQSSSNSLPATRIHPKSSFRPPQHFPLKGDDNTFQPSSPHSVSLFDTPFRADRSPRGVLLVGVISPCPGSEIPSSTFYGLLSRSLIFSRSLVRSWGLAWHSRCICTPS
jgi:hypothetical protein